ncbi:hypothetical protein B5E66_01550 [Faecalibacterium sp. An121]|nr:hypothetical protein B5E66_01550 [Faecalibacterium sp. An121]
MAGILQQGLRGPVLSLQLLDRDVFGIQKIIKQRQGLLLEVPAAVWLEFGNVGGKMSSQLLIPAEAVLRAAGWWGLVQRAS